MFIPATLKTTLKFHREGKGGWMEMPAGTEIRIIPESALNREQGEYVRRQKTTHAEVTYVCWWPGDEGTHWFAVPDSAVDIIRPVTPTPKPPERAGRRVPQIRI